MADPRRHQWVRDGINFNHWLCSRGCGLKRRGSSASSLDPWEYQRNFGSWVERQLLPDVPACMPQRESAKGEK